MKTFIITKTIRVVKIKEVKAVDEKSALELAHLVPTMHEFTINDPSQIKEEPKYQCIKCNHISYTMEFEDVECDGDVMGVCPNCKQYAVLVEPLDTNKDDNLFKLDEDTNISEEINEKNETKHSY